jgi:hypothetical protein
LSLALYESLREKWNDFLDEFFVPFSPLLSEDEVDDEYDDLVYDFCEEHGYKERTKDFAFYGRWYDTFADEYYGRLEKAGVKIFHENPEEADWDYGKKFRMGDKGWEEIPKDDSGGRTN